jgi:hypothetical protein
MEAIVMASGVLCTKVLTRCSEDVRGMSRAQHLNFALAYVKCLDEVRRVSYHDEGGPHWIIEQQAMTAFEAFLRLASFRSSAFRVPVRRYIDVRYVTSKATVRTTLPNHTIRDYAQLCRILGSHSGSSECCHLLKYSIVYCYVIRRFGENYHLYLLVENQSSKKLAWIRATWWYIQ